MNIDPKVEPWLRSLLDGVENSNHRAETLATEAYASDKLVKALEGIVANATYKVPAGNINCRFCDVDTDHLGTFVDQCESDCEIRAAKAALALARGETP